MGLFSKDRFRVCQPGEDSSIVECQAYKPSKSGGKDIVAVIRVQRKPDCTADILYEDGSPDDLANLQKYLNDKIGVKCIPKNS